MSSYIVEIVILAMVAAFLGMRLYSVLGERAEHEEESNPQFREKNEEKPRDIAPAPAKPVPASPSEPKLESMRPGVEQGVRSIAAADSRFDITGFLQGAQGAYEMILEAFWKGDRETLKELCDDDVYAGFEAAIDVRENAGETLDNRLVRIEETRIVDASLDGRMARIAVLFVADIAAVTRDKDGNVIAGSLDDAIDIRDIWTFSRDISAADPDWILDETDEG